MPSEVVVSSPLPVSRQASRRSRLNLFRRRKTVVTAATTELASPAPNCCFPRRKRTVAAPTTRSVHFSKHVETDTAGAATDFANRSGTPKLVRRRSRSVKRSESRKSFYSAVSSYSAVQRLRQDGDSSPSNELVTTDTSATDDVADTVAEVAKFTCVCSSPAHTVFTAITPLITPPNVEPGSYEELLVHAKAQVGNWITILDRSDSLDPQMIHVGVNRMKRMVMNRLAIPFTAVLEADDTLLRCWISTPVGAKQTTAGLKGQLTEDKDTDLGDWSATTTIVDYSIKWFCGGKTVRAMQMKRENPKLGTAYETRIALPDSAEGRILLYNITIVPGGNKPEIRVDRIYKYVSA